MPGGAAGAGLPWSDFVSGSATRKQADGSLSKSGAVRSSESWKRSEGVQVEGYPTLGGPLGGSHTLSIKKQGIFFGGCRGAARGCPRTVGGFPVPKFGSISQTSSFAPDKRFCTIS